MFEGREAARRATWKSVEPERLGWHWQCILVTCVQDKLPS